MDTKQSFRDQQEDIQKITKALINEFAPDETPFVDPLIEKYLSNVDTNNPWKTVQGSEEKPLAFSGDVELLAALLIPIVTSTLSKLIEFYTVEKMRVARQEVEKSKTRKALFSFTVETEVDKITKEVRDIIKISGLSAKKRKALIKRIMELITKEAIKRTGQ
jgi:hypothetical protein